jgi:dipeptidase
MDSHNLSIVGPQGDKFFEFFGLKRLFLLQIIWFTMRKIKRFLFLPFLTVVALLQGQSAKEQANCFSMLIGKEASADSAVYLAHNEDDWGELYVDWHKVARKKHASGEMVSLEKGGKVVQVAETAAYLWLQMPGMQFSDSYLNEYGVAIASNQCRSREDRPDLTDGGIGYYLRRLMIERAKTAREAVRIGGALVEQFGYHYSGRTYVIADKNEAWMMSVVMGRHWIAQRIPDEHIAIIPNYYTIQEIDLRDTVNFLGASDLITYAVERGWFDPNQGKRFNFREAYADIESLYGIWNIPRHTDAINHFAVEPIGYGYDLPFSFEPKEKITLPAIMDVMDAHGEGTEFEIAPHFANGNPHKTVIKRVCSEGNQYGMIAQLRKDLPDPIAHVLWLAPKRPCIQAFTPWYIGITSIPTDYSRGNPDACLANHFTEKDLKTKTSGKAYWTFKDLSDRLDEEFGIRSVDAKRLKTAVQPEILKKQPVFENLFISLYDQDPAAAIRVLNEYVDELARQQLIQSLELLEK